MCEIIEWLNSNSGFITALATIAVAIATIIYVTINHKLWVNMKNQSQRPKRDEEIRMLIQPMLEQCNNEIKYLNNYFFSGIRSFFDKIEFKRDSSLKILYDEFVGERSNLKKAIKEHEEIIPELKKNYDLLIKNDTFRSKINKFIDDFNKESSHKVPTEIEHMSNSIMNNMLLNTDISNNSLGRGFKSFWKKYGEEFFNMRDKKEFGIYYDNVKKLSKQLEQYERVIIAQLEKICREYLKCGLSLGIKK